MPRFVKSCHECLCCTKVYASNARGKSEKVIIGNVAINAEEGDRGEQREGLCGRNEVVKLTILLQLFIVTLSGGEDAGAVSVDSMVLVMAGLMFALLIVLIVVALFLQRRNQVISFSMSVVYSTNRHKIIPKHISTCAPLISYGT